MHIAYKAEKGLDLRQENGIAKVYLANMVHKVVDTAIQLHGALGYSQDTPLAPGTRTSARSAWSTGRTKSTLDGGPQRDQGLQARRHHGRSLRRRLHLGLGRFGLVRKRAAGRRPASVRGYGSEPHSALTAAAPTGSSPFGRSAKTSTV